MPAEGATCRPNCRPARRPSTPRIDSRARPTAVRLVSDVSRAYRDRAGRIGAGARRTSRCTPTTASCSRWSGPSGCGKTTLLELICGLQAPDRGHDRVRAGGADAPARPAAAVAQRARQRRARAAHRPASRAPQARARAAELFAELGLAGFEQAHPHELSGGMRQRVAFLRTLLSGKPRPVPGRAVRRARRDHARGDAGLAGPTPWSASRARSCSSPTTSRRRSCSPTASRCSRPGPAVCARRSRWTSPRPRSRTDAAVVALRERALIALARGAAVRRRVAHRRSLRRRPTASRAGAHERRCRALPALVLRRSARRVGALRRLGRRPARRPAGAPHDRRSAVGQRRPARRHNLAITAEEVGLGLALALALGFALGVLIHLSPPLRRAVYPLTVGSQAMPIAVIAAAARVLVGLRPAAQADRDRR